MKHVSKRTKARRKNKAVLAALMRLRTPKATPSDINEYRQRPVYTQLRRAA